MVLHRRISKIGGSLGVLIPRDLAEAMEVSEGTPVRLSLVGRELVVDPEDDTMSDASFRKAFRTVLRRHGDAFRMMAEYDAGKRKRSK